MTEPRRVGVPAALSRAQRSNLLPLTAWGYAWWRERSLTLLTGQPFTLAREAALFTALCRPSAGERWLDAGTSAGFYAGVLAHLGCRVDAVDLSPAMLRVAASKERSDRITWQHLNVEDSPLPEGAFDGVTVGATLNETADPARFLAALGRAVRPGGQVWLMYLADTAGPLQRALAGPGGLTFPDPAWVQRQLPSFRRAHLRQLGAVVFERYVLDGGGSRVVLE